MPERERGGLLLHLSGEFFGGEMQARSDVQFPPWRDPFVRLLRDSIQKARVLGIQDGYILADLAGWVMERLAIAHMGDEDR